MKAATARGLDVLAAVDFLTERRNGLAPSIRELGDHMGIRSTNGVREHLERLQAAGLLLRDEKTARSYRITPAGTQALVERRRRISKLFVEHVELVTRAGDA